MVDSSGREGWDNVRLNESGLGQGINGLCQSREGKIGVFIGDIKPPPHTPTSSRLYLCHARSV